MDKNLILWVIGTIVTIGIGYLSVRLTMKYRKKVSLCFIERDFIPLFKTIVKNLDTIEIRYRNNPISEKLVLIKATLINDGTTDIDSSIIHKPFSIRLPENFNCLELKITDCSPNLTAKINQVDNNNLIIEWDLLKKSEFISFDMVIEIHPIGKGLVVDDKLAYYSFDQRITNLDHVKKLTIPTQIESKFKKRRRFRMNLLSLSALVLILVMSIVSVSKNRDYRLAYYLLNSKNTVKINVTPIDYNCIKISSDDDSISKIISSKQFFAQRNIIVRCEMRKDQTGLIMASIYIIIILLVLIYLNFEYYSNRRIIKILKKSAPSELTSNS